MDSGSIRRGMYREMVEAGRERFGDENWDARMARYRKRPAEFALKVLGSRWWSAQEVVGRALVTDRRVAVKSGHGVGKTYLAADLALWFLFTHRPATVITTAATQRQVEWVLWQEIRRRFTGARKRLPGKLYKTRIKVGDHSLAIGLSVAKGVALQGFHCENLLIILDEASGIAEEFWQAAESLAVGGNNRILAIGNPLAACGKFYELFTRNSGWRKITINALHHPNVASKGTRIPGAVTAGWVEDKLEEWCEEEGEESVGSMGSVGSGLPIPPTLPTRPDTLTWQGKRYIPSDLFRIRILGEFPLCQERGLIPLAWITAAQTKTGEPRPHPGAESAGAAKPYPPPSGGRGAIRLSVDVARYGEDLTVIGFREGEHVRWILPIKGADTMQVAGEVKRLVFEHRPSTIAVDSIGLGAGVVDRLVEQGIEGLDPVNVSQPAFDREHFANRRAELYWGLRERFRRGRISLPDDALLAEELSSLRYRINSQGQIQIEAKEELKKRLGRSPDRADMLALLMDSSYDTLAVCAPVNIGPSEQARMRAEMSRW